jgi:beta-galactosidase
MIKKAFAFLWISAGLLLCPGETGAQTGSHEQEIRYSPRPTAVEALPTNQISINGTWLFNPGPSGNFWELQEKGAAGWATIQVPGDWTMQGFSVAPNTAAGYLKTIEIPAEWRGCRIKLRCDGVQSDVKIWVNGRQAGSHQGGFTAFELDITTLCAPGAKNTLALAVRNESLADELASGTQYAAYQFGGITRKISVMALPSLNISSLKIETDFDEGYKDGLLKVHCSVMNEGLQKTGNSLIRFKMSDPGQKLVSLESDSLIIPGLEPGERTDRIFEARIAGPKKWDPEHPHLYVLAAELQNAGRNLETIRQRFGFRKIEVVGNQVFVNGSPIKVKGVNRHETHPLLGRSLNAQLWRRDAELFRNANVNYIRTSHYPPAEEFLDCCDEIGLFVECEAPLVWIGHGANSRWKADDPHSKTIYPAIQRALSEMIEFNRNHPSIVIWSMANESAWGPNWVEAKKVADSLDPTRPKTFHDQALGGYNNYGSRSMPIANYHYPNEQMFDDVMKFARPILFGEYCHINCYNRQELAADPGVRDEYGRGFSRFWEKMEATPACLGGAIWAGINDIFFLPSGKAVGYGEWGIIDGWRREKPEYWHVKKSYSPVKVPIENVEVPAPGEPIKLQVINRHDFTNLNELDIKWEIDNEKGTAAMDLRPQAAGILKILPKTTGLNGKNLLLNFTSPKGFLIDSFKITIGEEAPKRPHFQTPGPGAIRLLRASDDYSAQGNRFSWTLDKKTGTLLKAEVDGHPLLIGGPVFVLLGQASGLCVTDYSLDIKPLNDVCSGWAAESVDVEEGPDAIAFLVKGTYKEAAGWYQIKINGNGQADFGYEFSSQAKINPRQYGLVFYLPREFQTLTWARRGQWSVYPDNHIGRPEGTARAVVPGAELKFRAAPSHDWKDDMAELGSADFRSTKQNIFWTALTSEKGYGLVLRSDGRHSSRTFLEKERTGFLAADFNTGGGDLFYAGHHKVDDRPLGKGDKMKGSFRLEFIVPDAKKGDGRV